MENKKFEVVASLSNIDWKGRKVTGSHNGTISIKEGKFKLNEKANSRAGKFVIDTTTITVLDITDPATNAQFVSHLVSGDFFASPNTRRPSLKLLLVKITILKATLPLKRNQAYNRF
jgi:hypothetical protein